jgi:hypothetical protein
MHHGNIAGTCIGQWQREKVPALLQIRKIFLEISSSSSFVLTELLPARIAKGANDAHPTTSKCCFFTCQLHAGSVVLL